MNIKKRKARCSASWSLFMLYFYFMNMNEMPIIMEKQKKNSDSIKEEMFCLFCLNVLNEGNFTVVEETIKEILDILFLTQSTKITNIAIMCDDCSVKLFAAFDFKTKCVETEDCIFPYINPEKQVDLREIYLNETGKEHLKDLSEDDKICRLCMQIVTCGFTPIKEVDVDSYCDYIPEINFSSTKEPIICRVCLDLLDTHTKFLKNCLETKEKIKGIREDKNRCIKHEDMQIKFEENYDSETQDIHNEPVDDEVTKRTTKSKLENYSCGGCKYCPIVEKKPLEPEPRKKRKRHSLVKATYVCDKCDFRTDERETFKYHNSELHGKLDVKIYECDKCDFKTSVHHSFVRHKWTCHGLSGTYKCDVCNYTAARKPVLRSHLKTHQLHKWKCDLCEYKTHHKGDLLRHAKRHKMPMYKCDYSGCEFKAIYKKSIRKHLLAHHPKAWRCDSCDFQTPSKGGLTRHAMRHKTPEEIPTYKCEYSDCDFQTRYKLHIRKHRRNHPPIILKCNSCDFQTRYSKALTQHAKKHRLPGECPTYKCEYSTCDFRTTYKHNMQRHLSTHQPKILKLPTHKCVYSDCEFKTKYKKNIRRHLLTHKERGASAANSVSGEAKIVKGS